MPTARKERPLTISSFRVSRIQLIGASEPKDYSMYQDWKNMPEQREEMLTYTGIELQECTHD